MPPEGQRLLRAIFGKGGSPESELSLADRFREPLESAGEEEVRVLADRLENRGTRSRWIFSAVAAAVVAAATTWQVVDLRTDDFVSSRASRMAESWFSTRVAWGCGYGNHGPDAFRIPDPDSLLVPGTSSEKILGRLPPDVSAEIFGSKLNSGGSLFAAGYLESVFIQRLKPLTRFGLPDYDGDWHDDWGRWPERFRLERATLDASFLSPLPPDFIETGRRLDSENGWFELLEAADTLMASPGVMAAMDGESLSGDPYRLSLLTGENFRKGIQQLDGAFLKSRFDSGARELVRTRMDALPPPRTVAERDAFPAIAVELRRSPLSVFPVLVGAIRLQTLDPAFQQDADGYLKVIARANLLLDCMEDNSVTIIDRQMLREAAVLLAKSLAEGAPEGLDPAVRARLDLSARAVDHRPPAPASLAGPDDSRRNYSFQERRLNDRFAALGDAAIPRAEWLPARKAEHALLDRVLAVGVVPLALGGMLVMGLLLHARGRFVANLGGMLAGSLRRRDWWLLLGAGIALPLAVNLVVTRVVLEGATREAWFHPFDPIEISIGSRAIQVLATLLLMVTTCSLLLRRILGRRLGVLGLDRPHRLWDWCPVAASLVALLYAGAEFYLPDQSAVIMGGRFLAFVVLWKAGEVLLFVLGRADRTPIRAAHAAAMIPVIGVISLTLVLCQHLHAAEERYHIASDPVWQRTDPQYPGMDLHERRLARLLEEKIRKIRAAGE